MPLARTLAPGRFFTALRPLRGANVLSGRRGLPRSTPKWRSYEICNEKEESSLRTASFLPHLNIFGDHHCHTSLLQVRNHLRQEACLNRLACLMACLYFRHPISRSLLTLYAILLRVRRLDLRQLIRPLFCLLAASQVDWSDGDSGTIDGHPFRLANVDAPESDSKTSRRGL